MIRKRLALGKPGAFLYARGEPDANIQEVQPMRQQDTRRKYLRMCKKISEATIQNIRSDPAGQKEQGILYRKRMAEEKRRDPGHG